MVLGQREQLRVGHVATGRSRMRDGKRFHIGLVIGHPPLAVPDRSDIEDVDHGEDHRAGEGEQPPPRHRIVILLNSIVLVLEDSIAAFIVGWLSHRSALRCVNSDKRAVIQRKH